ncbi:MAG: YHS domain protein [Roseivirga sp.]|nr:YHS domain protein [Roseivirga sp.]
MKTLLTVSLLFSVFIVNAQSSDYALEHYNIKSGLAIKGYDPVAYFTENKAVEGKSAIKYTNKGVTYRFASESNKKLFIADPAKYEPAYGGYCAYAMAFGDKVKIDPETFKVKDGRLFLFYNFNFTNTLKKWNRDEAKLYGKAEDAWKKIVIEK